MNDHSGTFDYDYDILGHRKTETMNFIGLNDKITFYNSFDVLDGVSKIRLLSVNKKIMLQIGHTTISVKLQQFCKMINRSTIHTIYQNNEP